MRSKLYEIISHFTLVQWAGDPPLTNEEAYMQLADFLIGNNVIVAPVKPGDTVYTIHRGRIKEWKVYFVGMNSLGEFTFNIADEPLENSRSVWDREIGDTVFLTEEDAINELKERKDGEKK